MKLSVEYGRMLSPEICTWGRKSNAPIFTLAKLKEIKTVEYIAISVCLEVGFDFPRDGILVIIRNFNDTNPED